jgi:uncharacterized membrane protein
VVAWVPRSARVSLGFTVVVLGLLALHLWPPHGGPAPIVFGVFPWDLAWHLAWMAAATLVVFAMTSRRLWPDRAPTPEHDQDADEHDV